METHAADLPGGGKLLLIFWFNKNIQIRIDTPSQIIMVIDVYEVSGTIRI